MASAPLTRSLVFFLACALALPSLYPLTTEAETPAPPPARISHSPVQELLSPSSLAQCEFPRFWSHGMTNSPSAQRITEDRRPSFAYGAPHAAISLAETLKGREDTGPLVPGAPILGAHTEGLFLTITRYFGVRGFDTPEKLTIVESRTPNAFARRHREVVLTDALLARVTDRSELAFILAHEVAHVALGHGIHGGIAAEVAADALALQAVTALGFNPCSGPSVLERLGTPSQLTLVSVTPRLHALHDKTSPICG
jgi:hypothetical protein